MRRCGVFWVGGQFKSTETRRFALKVTLRSHLNAFYARFLRASIFVNVLGRTRLSPEGNIFSAELGCKNSREHYRNIEDMSRLVLIEIDASSTSALDNKADIELI
jgi:hypothetical protein